MRNILFTLIIFVLSCSQKSEEQKIADEFYNGDLDSMYADFKRIDEQNKIDSIKKDFKENNPFAKALINTNISKNYHPKSIVIWNIPGEYGSQVAELKDNTPVFIIDSFDMSKMKYYEYLHIMTKDKSIKGFVYSDKLKNIELIK
ncbi:MAG: hypothetical protein H6604_03000 [Flavobacteriales bacterium]|nr:hypothetical protein [Flavobacteriales bacterium]